MSLNAEHIGNWVAPGSRVLDLGCGDGHLLATLTDTHRIHGLGLELDPDKIALCLDAGLSVVQQDLNAGLYNFRAKQFDTVIMTQTLQAIRRPDRLLQDMLRVGREGIVTFPNFAYFKNRLQLGFGGHMPVNPQLPNPWYDTPNIHLSTFDDFEALCASIEIRILDRETADLSGRGTWAGRIWPNLFGEMAIYRLTQES